MTRIELTYRVLLTAAKPTAAFVLFWLSVPLFLRLRHCFSFSYAYSAYRDWLETAALLAFVGYAAFIILPVHRLVGRAFWFAVAVGSVLGIASICLSTIFYSLVIVGINEGKLVYHVLAWILLIPIYGYIPVLVLNRRHVTGNQRVPGCRVDSAP